MRIIVAILHSKETFFSQIPLKLNVFKWCIQPSALQDLNMKNLLVLMIGMWNDSGPIQTLHLRSISDESLQLVSSNWEMLICLLILIYLCLDNKLAACENSDQFSRRSETKDKEGLYIQYVAHWECSRLHLVKHNQ